MSSSSKKSKTPGTARFQSPTITSLERTKDKDPTGIRTKVATLDVALHQLHRELEIDQYKTEHIEKKQSSQYEKLSSQVYALRQAFDKLADSVMEETEKIRKDVVDELRQTTNSTFSAIEKIQGQIQRNEEERLQNALKVQGVMKELKSHAEALYEKFNSLQKEIFIIQEEQKTQFEAQMKRYEELKQRVHYQNERQTEMQSENQMINKEVLNLGMKSQQI